METKFVEHPLIKKGIITYRTYQIELAEKSLRGSSLVILPTGLGKTVVALLVMVARLQKEDGKVLVLSPTRPLVNQHTLFFKNALNINEIGMLTGEIPPHKRHEIWSKSKIIVSTPQVVENDLIARRASLKDFVLVIFDEAHRAVGNYAYTYIAKKYYEECDDPLVLGMTASPGSDEERIKEVCSNLGIEYVHYKGEKDPDVRKYIPKKEIEWIEVPLPPEIKKLRSDLYSIFEDMTDKLIEMCPFGIRIPKNPTKKELLSLQQRILSEIKNSKEQYLYHVLSIIAELLKLSHGIELIETQGVSAFRKYIERLRGEAESLRGSKASKRLLSEIERKGIIYRLQNIDVEHPKLEMVSEIIRKQIEENPSSLIIVFTNFRDSAQMVLETLSNVEGVRAIRFVGQGSREGDKGLSQKEQVETLKKFSTGEYNVLVATSVAEEGLDIPSTDLVIFYEPVPSEIRSIQRKGRTGRRHYGRVVVLITKGTRDEAFYWSSMRKERRMEEKVGKIGISVEREEKKKEERKPVIYVDIRELRSGIVKYLENETEVFPTTLEVGDYILSERVGVERKTAQDLINSLVDGNRDLFLQLSDLSKTFSRPILIVEGEDVYSVRNVHPNAIKGLFASITVDFGIPIVFTKDKEETAEFLKIVARREQEERGERPIVHGKKTFKTLSERQEYVVSSIPGVGPKVAKNLLKKFGSVEKVMSASEEELKKAPLVGDKTAKAIREIVGSEYKG
jgi:Fanconi anemia group M protein